jgi:hypothetical protein
VAELFRKTASAITGRTRRRRGAIERLQDSARALGSRIDARKKDARDEAAQAWTKLEKRHAAERARDEQRIEQRRRDATGRQSGDRALKQFNLRGDPATARHVQPQTRPLILTHAHVAAASPVPQPRRAESIIARLARKLGWRGWKDLPAPTRERLTPPEQGTAHALPRPPRPVRSFEMASAPRQPEQAPARKSAETTESYERRVEKNLAGQERNEQRQQRDRRKRKRPRSKVRRIGDG